MEGEADLNAQKLRFAVAGIVQESNTFALLPSTMADFSVQMGDAILATRGTNTEVGGLLDELYDLGVEVVPLLSSWAVSAGPMDDETFETLSGLLIDSLRRTRVDGVLLALHGAWLSSSYPSADAEIVVRVRKAVGPGVPVVITQDYHANISPHLLENVEGLVGYRTYPHIDMAETGRKAAKLLHQIVIGGLDPWLYWLPIPLIASAQRATTDQPPIEDILARLDRELPPDEVLSSSFFCVQPWLDRKGVASSIVVVASNDSEKIPAAMRSIASELWDRKEEFHVDWTTSEELVPEVFKEKRRPVIVSEAFDAPSGGAPGDHPGLLSILYPHRERISACLYMVDPKAATAAHRIGAGGEGRGPLGANMDTRFGSPVDVDARILNVSKGIFSNQGPVFHGRTLDMGATVTLGAGRLRIVVASRAVMMVDPELYRSQGVEPSEQDIVGVKSPTLFRPGYATMLGRVINLDMPGVCRGNLVKVPFQDIGRPIWPLDHFHWDASGEKVRAFHKGGQPA